MAGRKSILVLAAGILLFALPTKADLTISSKPTQNVSCSAGACSATDKKAILNVGELIAMLGSGDVTVSTGGVAKDIEVSAALSWASTSRLTLDADKSLVVKQPVTVAGSGALTLSSNRGHQKVDLEFFGKGNIQFWDLSSSLVINGKSYTLVGDIATLAANIAANPSGTFALAHDYDASADGTYSSSPIPTTFTGEFDGLGNTISSLKVNIPNNGTALGLFAVVQQGGQIRSLGLTNIDFEGSPLSAVGPIAAGNDGLISRSWTSGLIRLFAGGTNSGGLVGANFGEIIGCHAAIKFKASNVGLTNLGQLVGENDGTVSLSYATGSIKVGQSRQVNVGGLVGLNTGSVENSYTVASIFAGKNCCGDNDFGGLIGKNDGIVVSAYAAGNIVTWNGDTSGLGGLIGFDAGTVGDVLTSYWDLDAGISDPSQGAGNIENDPGITGLTAQQLQSGLPSGFDPMTWGHDMSVNNGFPYLTSNPP
jgi:hypothetical protein